MPSEVEPVTESVEETKARYVMEEIEALEIVAKQRSNENRAKESRKLLKQRFLARDLTFEEMFKQSCARVYYMKSNLIDMIEPFTYAWSLPPVADKLLSRFKYNKKKSEEAERFLTAALKLEDHKQIAEYREVADLYLTKCLHAHYGIGVIYGQFLDGATKVGGEEPTW